MVHKITESKLKVILLVTAFLQTISLMISTPAFGASVGVGGGSGGTTQTVTGSNFGDLGFVFSNLIDALLGLIGAITIVILVWGGIRYILSTGDQKALESARNTITFALIGLGIVLLAVTIVLIIQNTFGIQFNLTSFFLPGPGQQIP